MDFCPNCDTRLKKNDDGLLACSKCQFVKEKTVDKENTDVEKETSLEIDDTSKMPVKEIIGDNTGKNPTNIKEEE